MAEEQNRLLSGHESPTLSASGRPKRKSSLEFSVPGTNLEAYRILYSLENALRELIIEQLKEVGGPKWYKQRLPGDVLKSYKAAREVERKIPWAALVPHHPIYYVDFPSLKKVIESNDNWKDAFKQFFGRKDVCMGWLSSIEYIRNKVAHSRYVDGNEVLLLRTTYNSLAEAVGKSDFAELASRSKRVPDIVSCLVELKAEGERAADQCNRTKPLEHLQNWCRVSSDWWFEESYIGCNLSPITDYFWALENYNELPRCRGSGHSVELWVRDIKLDALFERSNKLLEDLVKEAYAARKG